MQIKECEMTLSNAFDLRSNDTDVEEYDSGDFNKDLRKIAISINPRSALLIFCTPKIGGKKVFPSLTNHTKLTSVSSMVKTGFEKWYACVYRSGVWKY